MSNSAQENDQLNENEEMNENENDCFMSNSFSTRQVLYRNPSQSFYQYIIHVFKQSSSKQLTIAELQFHTGYPIKRLKKRLSDLEKEGLVVSKLINYRRSFTNVYLLPDCREGVDIPSFKEGESVKRETKHDSLQSHLRREKVIQFVYNLFIHSFTL